MISAAISVDPLWFDVAGGVGTYIRNLVPAIVARDPSVDVTLFHARFDRPEPVEPWMEGLRIRTLRASPRTLYPSWNLAGRPRLPRSLADAEVIHATSGVAIPPVEPGHRLVVTIHDLAFLRYPRAFPRRWRLLYRLGLRAARRADAVLAPSRSTANDVVRVGISESRVRIVPLAAAPPAADVDDDRARDALRRLGIDEPYVLFVGTLEPRKNLITLVRAYRRAAGAGLVHALVIAGAPGWGLDSLERELAAGGAGTIVRTGAVSSDDLEVLYRGATAFVYPSLYEGFGLPVLEAMARGIPTITSNVSSLPEVAGDAAIAIDPTSADELADAVERVATDESLAARLSSAGRERAARFSWDETARLTLEAYRGE